ncbi:hypothetical protein J4H86_12440 [Spiractinospora alimapuensis]|uniref:hypothetical protein n=1 Tax=Spiractinospora alimapuensis TaxID=2820884 RepID=UPI001F441ED6|nr:hypothetical protein [Spiractinospora alimapuensis]QVQ54404.1 hypothetical protein J4H86_12440 [Spiractinospora alimapuensis]
MTLPPDHQHPPEDDTWSTFPDQCVVLVIVRTLTSAVVALETLKLFRGDSDVQVRFAIDSGTAFHAGVEELLTDVAPGHHPPLDEAGSLRPCLVLTASENVDLSPFTCPIVLVQHGIGFNKYVPDSRTQEVRLSGVPRPEFTDWPNLTTLLGHPAQREQLVAAGLHTLAKSSEVVGDPAHDAMRASGHLRDRYRAALGLEDGQTLVAVSSTWGPESLIGRHRHLPGDLLAELPHDTHRVALVLHPNAWSWHSPWHVHNTYADALEAGLLLIPPERGWGATLLAADVVLGDHGSVTLYAAGIRRPVLLASDGGADSVSGTPAEELRSIAPRLAVDAPLAPQIQRAIADHHPGAYDAWAARTFAHVDDAHTHLRDVLYQRLGRRPPTAPPWRPALPQPQPRPAARPVTAFEIHTRHVDGSAGPAASDRTVEVVRHPASVRSPRDVAGTYRHLAVAESHPNTALTHLASVVYTEAPTVASARAWTEIALDSFPGCLLTAATAGDEGRVAIRGADTWHVHGVLGLDTSVWSAAVYARLRSGASLEGTHVVRVARSTHVITVTTHSPDPQVAAQSPPT